MCTILRRFHYRFALSSSCFAFFISVLCSRVQYRHYHIWVVIQHRTSAQILIPLRPAHPTTLVTLYHITARYNAGRFQVADITVVHCTRPSVIRVHCQIGWHRTRWFETYRLYHRSWHFLRCVVPEFVCLHEIKSRPTSSTKSQDKRTQILRELCHSNLHSYIYMSGTQLSGNLSGVLAIRPVNNSKQQTEYSWQRLYTSCP